MTKNRNMNRTIIAALMIFAASVLSAQPKISLRPQQTVMLYADSFEGNIDPVYGKEILYAGLEMAEATGLGGAEEISSSGMIRNVSDLARIDLYFPRKGNGQMVVVCPGGGYTGVSTYNEGLYVAEWLLSKGIAAAVVKYRMPNGHCEVPLTDVQNTFRYCRAHAGEWNITQIGVMGFSAGGHLAASASTLYVDKETRPDFSILIYPVTTMNYEIYKSGSRPSLLGEDERWAADPERLAALIERFSLNKQATPDTPSTFIAHSTNDKTLVDNSLIYYKSLLDNKVSVEMHLFPTGGHGWGFSSEKIKGKGKDKLAYARNEFYTSLERWLDSLR
jgi:acetyl esterase/lipase